MVGEEQKMTEQEQLKESLRGEKTKELIIDCINVNECEFYGYDGICKLYSGSICSKDCSNYPNCNYKQLKRKEQECERLNKQLISFMNGDYCANGCSLKQQLDQLKEEVKSKTEYIQEQREIIDQYSKEIEMYKKCQGKRASKREEELKAENEEWQKKLDKIEKEKTNE